MRLATMDCIVREASLIYTPSNPYIAGDLDLTRPLLSKCGGGAFNVEPVKAEFTLPSDLCEKSRR